MSNLVDRGPVFVVGLGRSGTSLTRSLINGHGAFAVAPEIHFIDHWMPRFRRLDIDSGFDAFWSPFVAGKHFPRLEIDASVTRSTIRADRPISWRKVFRTLLVEHAAAKDRARWGEKTPVYFRHIARLLDWFPHAAIVYLLRDPRAVAASHQRVGQEWADLDPSHVAKTWLESVRIGESWATDPRLRLFRYEDIVAAPEETLKDLFRFIGEEFTPALLGRRVGEGSRQDGPFGPGAPISAAHVDVWRERLSPRDVSIIERVAGRTMGTYGYERVGNGFRVRTLTEIQVARGRRAVARVSHAIHEPRDAASRLSARAGRRVRRPTDR